MLEKVAKSCLWQKRGTLDSYYPRPAAPAPSNCTATSFESSLQTPISFSTLLPHTPHNKLLENSITVTFKIPPELDHFSVTPQALSERKFDPSPPLAPAYPTQWSLHGHPASALAPRGLFSAGALISRGRCNKLPWNWSLKTAQIYSLTVVRSPKWVSLR